jgi:hypothetical protein
MKNTTVDDCRTVELPKIAAESGNITAINSSLEIPFDIKRVYYLYDVPAAEERGGHAHKELQQIIIAAMGSFDLVIDDGEKKKIITLNRPFTGVYIVPGIWRELKNFSAGSICLVLASNIYDENDYIRDIDKFRKYKDG